MTEERHLIAVPISFPLIIEMMKQGYIVEHGFECVNGIPEDAKFIYSFVDDRTGCGYLVFEHESFNAIPLGAVIPQKVVEYRKINA